MINPNDIHYAYDTHGYMLYYKDKPIGGAGIDKSAKGCSANLKLFREQAEIDKQRILNGIDHRYLVEIERIDKEETNNEC